MGNKGAFITMIGKDMKPNYTTYEAVVSILFFYIVLLSCQSKLIHFYECFRLSAAYLIRFILFFFFVFT